MERWTPYNSVDPPTELCLLGLFLCPGPSQGWKTVWWLSVQPRTHSWDVVQGQEKGRYVMLGSKPLEHALLFHWIPLIKHKCKDKVIEYFKLSTTEHQLSSMRTLSEYGAIMAVLVESLWSSGNRTFRLFPHQAFDKQEVNVAARAILKLISSYLPGVQPLWGIEWNRWENHYLKVRLLHFTVLWYSLYTSLNSRASLNSNMSINTDFFSF
jgi:hypothetical protein